MTADDERAEYTHRYRQWRRRVRDDTPDEYAHALDTSVQAFDRIHENEGTSDE